MGMFDDIKFETECSNCGNKVKDFQSKDGACCMFLLDFWEVNNFYSSCNKCRTGVEYKIYSKPNRKLIIADYDKIVTTPGEISKNIYRENNKKFKDLFAKKGNQE